MPNKKSSNEGHGMEIGLTIAGLAAIAGGVFLYGTDAGKKKRKEIKGWTLKAKGEVLEKMEALKEVNEEAYHKIVDSVAARYEKVKSIEPIELAAVVADLRKSWKDISRLATSTKKNARAKSAPKKKPAAKSTASKAKKPAAKSASKTADKK